MSRLLSVAFVCVLLASAALTVGGMATVSGGAVQDSSGEIAGDTLATSDRSDDSSEQDGDSATSAFVTQDRFDTTEFRITVYENGSARWTISHFTPVLNNSEQTQFKQYATRFRTDETDLWQNFQTRATQLAAVGSETTDRNMTATSFQRNASIDALGSPRGVVRMSFLWTDFAPTANETVVAADVFEGGFYVAPGHDIVFEAGPGLSFDSDGIDPEPDAYSGQTIAESDTVTWEGERSFTDERPQVTFVSGQATTTPITTATSGATTTDTVTAATTEATPTSGGAGGGSQEGLLVVALLILAVGLGASVAWRAGVFDSESPSDESGETTAPPAATSPESGSDTETESRTEPEAESETESAVADEELLSDEDRVLNMLESNGGRMKQANIVDETGWSKSKVSMLLSDMEDDEEISKLRVGRENIVSLRGQEPDAAGSPFDDDE